MSTGQLNNTAKARGLAALSALVLGACATTATPAATTATSSTATVAASLRQEPEALLQDTALAVAYSGFRAGQHPDRGSGSANPTDDQIIEDLQLIVSATNFRLIRLYDSGEVSQSVLRLIAKHKLPIRVMLGAWLNAELSNHEGCAWLTEPIPASQLEKNKKANQQETLRAIRLAKEYPDIIVAINVGNEALVTWNDHLVTVEALLGYATQVKAAVKQPVTTADNYVVWAEQGARLMEVLDFAAVHTYPAWENKTIDEAMPYTIENMQAVRDALPTAQLVIAEAGWASVASEFGERASEAKQKRYVDELLAWAKLNNITTFIFEAFDEDWKGNSADPLGAEKHWGLFTIDRKPKRVLAD